MKDSSPNESQAVIAARILAQKQLADIVAPEHAEQADDGDMPGDQGMTSTPRIDYPHSGAFDAEGQRPALERSRKVR